MKQIKIHAAASGGTPVIFLMNDDPAQKLNTQIIPCNGEVIGMVWLKPYVHDNLLKGYQPIGDTGTKPSVDSLLTIQYRRADTFEDVYIAVADDTTIDALGTACDLCCEAGLPEIAAPEVPVVILGDIVCPVDGDYIYNAVQPVNANSNNYIIYNAFFNGVEAAALDPAGYTTMANLLTAVQATYTGVGTWTLDTSGDLDHLILTSTTTTSASFPISLVPKTYCLELGEDDLPINGIVLGGVLVTFPTVTISRTNPEIAFNAIAPFLIGTFGIETYIDIPHFEYTGLQVPTDIQMDAAVVVSFTVGACS